MPQVQAQLWIHGARLRQKQGVREDGPVYIRTDSGREPNYRYCEADFESSILRSGQQISIFVHGAAISDASGGDTNELLWQFVG